MEQLDHLFISPTGAMLPSWQQAFGGARGIAMDALPSALSASLVWLRLGSAAPLAEQLGAVKARCAGVPVVMLSDRPDDNQALAAFSAQARGYCNSHAGPELLLKVASVVSQGGLWIGETLMHRMLSVQRHIVVPESAARPDWRASLTGREVSVAELAAAGTRNKEIARLLDITERTVKAHMGAVLEKLGLRDRLQLALLIGGRLRP